LSRGGERRHDRVRRCASPIPELAIRNVSGV
jgi:hypothetical protein